MATYYIKKVKEVQPQGPYYLAGYSFGAMVAIEMSFQLEAALGKKAIGSLLILDGSHLYVSAQTRRYRNKYEQLAAWDNADAQSDAICSFLYRFISVDYQRVKEELLACADLQTRLKYAVDLLLPTFGHVSEATLMRACESHCMKLFAADIYEPKTKLHTSVCLVRASENPVGETLGSDYELTKICEGEVTVHAVKATHSGIIEGKAGNQVAQLFNEYLHL